MHVAEWLLYGAQPLLVGIILQGKALSNIVKFRVNAVGLVKGKKFVDAAEVFCHAFDSVLSLRAPIYGEFKVSHFAKFPFNQGKYVLPVT